jgi:hypothetical protein
MKGIIVASFRVVSKTSRESGEWRPETEDNQIRGKRGKEKNGCFEREINKEWKTRSCCAAGLSLLGLRM